MRTNPIGAAAIASVALAVVACSSEVDPQPELHEGVASSTVSSTATVGAGGEATGGAGGEGGVIMGTGGFVTADHEPFPQLENAGGPILADPQLVTITFPGYAYTSDVEDFGDWIVGSDWLITVGAEYGVGKGDHVQKVVMPEAAPITIDDEEIKAMLTSRIADGTLPTPPALQNDYLYMVYFPEETTITLFGSESCTGFGGYHVSVDTDTLSFAYAVMPTCPDSGLQGVTGAASHEFIEAATDAHPLVDPAFQLTDYDSSWSALGGEVADLCVFGGLQAGGFYVTRSWSNAAAAAGTDPCVPATKDPYFSVSPKPAAIQLASPGQTLKYTLTGWSTEKMDDWQLVAADGFGIPLDPKLDVNTMNNGKTATLTLTVPGGAPPQSFGLVAVMSAKSKTKYNIWPIGLYIP